MVPANLDMTFPETMAPIAMTKPVSEVGEVLR